MRLNDEWNSLDEAGEEEDHYQQYPGNNARANAPINTILPVLEEYIDGEPPIT